MAVGTLPHPPQRLFPYASAPTPAHLAYGPRLASLLSLRVCACLDAQLSSVDVSMTFVLEGRAEDELPERHLSTFAINALEQTELTAQPPSWPSSEADVAAIPGEAIGPRTSGRGSDVVGSWQLTRVIVTEEKERAANGGGEAAPRKLTQIRSLGGRALNWTRSRGSAEDIS